MLIMGKSLRLNAEAALQGLYKEIQACADSLLEEYYNEVQTKLKTNAAKADIAKMSDDEEKTIRRKVIAGAEAIMDSYGTGSAMDTSNPFLSEYKNSLMWNTLRSADNAITGRPAGEYTNIYGETQHSTGGSAGVNLEWKYHPQTPSYAFQEAEIWFFKGDRVQIRLNEAISQFFKSIGRYFTFG